MNKTTRILALVPVLGVMAAASLVERPLDPEPNEVRGPERRNTAGAVREYGAPVSIGRGGVRTYVEIDPQGGVPLELGVAIDSAGLEGLPTGPEPTMLHLELPRQAPSPYRFVMLDWNPQGHEPVSVYTVPHFDFHFYTVSHDEVARILPDAPGFAEHANHLPESSFVPEHYIPFAEPGQPPASVAVPQMGVHWLDARSPELQAMMGKPEAHQPFTRTFIYGSWDGKFTFYEPMITLAHLLSRPNETIEIPRPARFADQGWYPASYRIRYDGQAGEYRIALSDLRRYQQ